LGALLVQTLYAESSDTLPLKNKTSPTGNTDLTQNPLFNKGQKPTSAEPEEASVEESVTKNGKGQAKPYIASLETFGSNRLNETSLRQLLGKKLDAWFAKGLKGDASSIEDEQKLKEIIQKKYAFALAEWSIIQYFEPGDLAVHVTLDLVEPKDVATRMPFQTAPKEKLADPDDFIKKWQEYEDLSLDLIDKGELEAESADCVAFHCPFGHKHLKLQKYEKMFVDGVKKNEQALVDITKKDSRPEYRGAACYLLAYLKDGKKVVNYLVDRIKDPEDIVRNNALRVLGDIAELHPEYVIPLNPILEAIRFPRVSDRSKSVYVLYHLASNSRQVRDEILKGSVPDLLKILESKQPDHRELAHGILRKISGKDIAATDIRAWNSWYSRLPANSNVTKK
jgi:hypothetical protein